MATVKDDLGDGKLDLVPMIDCIMLLLLFFILTTKFSAEEEVISSVLPTDKGPGGRPSDIVPKTRDIFIYPAGYQRGERGAEHLAQRWDGEPAPRGAVVRYGNCDQVFTLDGRLLDSDANGRLDGHLAGLHEHLAAFLRQDETGASKHRDLPGTSPSTASRACRGNTPWPPTTRCALTRRRWPASPTT